MDLHGAYEAVRAAFDKGDLEILFTHVTVEVLAAISDYERRCRLLIFLIDLGRLLPTGAFIVGASRLRRTPTASWLFPLPPGLGHPNR